MKDDFLAQFREQPRRDFANTLYGRISQPKPSRLAGKLTFRNAVLALIVLVLIVACVRAVTAPRWVKIGDIWVDVQRHYENEFFVIGNVGYLPYSHQVEQQAYTLSDVEETVDAKVPAWAPDDFKFDRVVWLDDRSASLIWKNQKDDSIRLVIGSRKWLEVGLYERIASGATWPVAPGNFKEIQVNGRPAVLVRGDWARPASGLVEADERLEWDKKAAIQLYWVEGEWLYHLFASPSIAAEDLTRMAESAK